MPSPVRMTTRAYGEGPLRIAIIAPPLLPLPPQGYAGTERIISTLAVALHEQGHQVTVFGTGDSDLPVEIVPVVPRALWPSGHRGNLSGYLNLAVAAAWEQSARFDVIHSHVDTAGFAMARYSETPVVTTLHGRLDMGGTSEMIDHFGEIPLVAISDSQRRWNESANWVATIHHGLPFEETPASDIPGDYLLLIGRITREKGIAEAIEVARRTDRQLVIAAKVHEVVEREMFGEVVEPAIQDGIVDWRGEVGTAERDELMAGALATLMLGSWPEPFGLVAIESMATGTPVIARRAGGNTETVQHGTTGFLVDDLDEAVLAVRRVASLRREPISAYARTRFSVARMTGQYERVFRSLVAHSTEAPISAVASSATSRGRRLSDIEQQAELVAGG